MERYTDFLIVGQGLAGTALAEHLLKSSYTVHVVNSAIIPASSMVATGLFNPLVFKRVTESWRANELISILKIFYSHIETKIKHQVLHEKPICKLITEEEFQWFYKQVEKKNLHAYIRQINEYPEISGVKKYRASAILKHCGYVNVKKLIESYRDYLKRLGAYTSDKVDCNDIIIRDDSVQWKNIKAKAIVFCEGVHAANNRLFPTVKYYPTKGELVEFESTQLSSSSVLNKDVFILPYAKNRFICGSTYNHINISVKPTEEGKNQILNKLDKILDFKPKVINHWAGVRPTIKDRRPVLGLHPEFKNVAYFNGLGTKGVMLSPYFAGEMVKLLTQKNYILDKEVRLERFL